MYCTPDRGLGAGGAEPNRNNVITTKRAPKHWPTPFPTYNFPNCQFLWQFPILMSTTRIGLSDSVLYSSPLLHSHFGYTFDCSSNDRRFQNRWGADEVGTHLFLNRKSYSKQTQRLISSDLHENRADRPLSAFSVPRGLRTRPNCSQKLSRVICFVTRLKSCAKVLNASIWRLCTTLLLQLNRYNVLLYTPLALN